MTQSRSAHHFQQIYRSNPDPWAFASSPYEQAKYRQTLAALGDRHFAAGLEVGCSIGILTRLLASHCNTLLGIDLVEEPLLAATARCADQPHVQFKQMQVPDQWPERRFDLIVLSEVLYFLSERDIDRCAEHALRVLLPNPVVVMVNWLGNTQDPTSGDAAAERFIAATSLRLEVRRQERHEGYRLDVLGNRAS